MSTRPESVEQFLRGKRFAVAGVSREGRQPANLIFRRLVDSGYEVVPVNPDADRLEGARCYPDLLSVPGEIDGVVVVTHPRVSARVVREAASRGIRRIWFHRSFGDGSVSDEALAECASHGIDPIVGGCPMMYCGAIDPVHRCFRWWLALRRRIPT